MFSNWQANKTLSGVYKYELVRYMYAIIVVHAMYTKYGQSQATAILVGAISIMQ